MVSKKTTKAAPKPAAPAPKKGALDKAKIKNKGIILPAKNPKVESC